MGSAALLLLALGSRAVTTSQLKRVLSNEGVGKSMDVVEAGSGGQQPLRHGPLCRTTLRCCEEIMMMMLALLRQMVRMMSNHEEEKRNVSLTTSHLER